MIREANTGSINRKEGKPTPAQTGEANTSNVFSLFQPSYDTHHSIAHINAVVFYSKTRSRCEVDRFYKYECVRRVFSYDSYLEQL